MPALHCQSPTPMSINMSYVDMVSTLAFHYQIMNVTFGSFEQHTLSDYIWSWVGGKKIETFDVLTSRSSMKLNQEARHEIPSV